MDDSTGIQEANLLPHVTKSDRKIQAKVPFQQVVSEIGEFFFSAVMCCDRPQMHIPVFVFKLLILTFFSEQFDFGGKIYWFILSSLSEASPDAVSATLGGAVNSDPGSPSDDEDLPHPASSMRATCGASPTGSDEGSLIVNGACYYEDDSIWGVPGQMGVENLLPAFLSSHTHRQVSLNDYLDALEVARNSGDRPMTGPLPKLRSSFPTDTRLNAMLHIDSDEDEETAGQHREQPQEARTQPDSSSLSATAEAQLWEQGLNVEPREQTSALATTDACSPADPQSGNETSGPIPAQAEAGVETVASTSQTRAASQLLEEPSAAPQTPEAAAAAPEVRNFAEECSSQQQCSRTGTSQEAFGSSSFGLLSPIQVSFIKVQVEFHGFIVFYTRISRTRGTKNVGEIIFRDLMLLDLDSCLFNTGMALDVSMRFFLNKASKVFLWGWKNVFLPFCCQEVQMIKAVAPKAEEEGVESSSSEANGPVGGATCACITEGGGGTSEVGRSIILPSEHTRSQQLIQVKKKTCLGAGASGGDRQEEGVEVWKRRQSLQASGGVSQTQEARDGAHGTTGKMGEYLCFFLISNASENDTFSFFVWMQAPQLRSAITSLFVPCQQCAMTSLATREWMNHCQIGRAHV